jgi:hypothetical protein
VTGTVGPVYASKRLFTRLDFQSDNGLESANCRHFVLTRNLLAPFVGISGNYTHVGSVDIFGGWALT